jgi:hypothetical protein
MKYAIISFLTLMLISCEEACEGVKFETMYSHVASDGILEVYYISNSHKSCAEQAALEHARRHEVSSRPYQAYYITDKSIKMPVGTSLNTELLSNNFRVYTKPLGGEGGF